MYKLKLTKSILLLLGLATMFVTLGANCSNKSNGNDSVYTDSLALEVEAQAPAMLDSVVLVFAGDAMQHDRQLAAAKNGENYDYTGCFAAIEPYVSSADYAVVNLETTLAYSNFSGYPMFCSPVSYAEELKKTGFDMLLTANNHCLDRRDAGVRRTINILDSIKVDHIGTYTNQQARNVALPFIKEVNGMKIAMLVYTYGTNGIDIQGDVAVDYINRDQITKDIKAARDAGAEMVCVNMHWGDEYKLLPNAEQKRLADFLVDQGVDLVIGGHPHVIEPSEMRTRADGSKALVVYSMGNLISGMRTTDTRGGVLIKAVLRRDDAGKPYVARAEYLPVFVAPPDAQSSNYRLVIADDSADSNAKAFLRNAYNTFDNHNVDVLRATR